MEAGIEAAIAEPAELASAMQNAAALDTLPLEQRMFVVARAGLQRLSEQRDLNRLVLRDLAQFDDLLGRVRELELGRFFADFTRWLRHQPEAAAAADVDWDATAMVLMGAVSHYWIMVDIFGVHPMDLDEERYLGAAARLAASALAPRGTGAEVTAASGRAGADDHRPWLME